MCIEVENKRNEIKSKIDLEDQDILERMTKIKQEEGISSLYFVYCVLCIVYCVLCIKIHIFCLRLSIVLFDMCILCVRFHGGSYIYIYILLYTNVWLTFCLIFASLSLHSSLLFCFRSTHCYSFIAFALSSLSLLSLSSLLSPRSLPPLCTILPYI